MSGPGTGPGDITPPADKLSSAAFPVETSVWKHREGSVALWSLPEECFQSWPQAGSDASPALR